MNSFKRGGQELGSTVWYSGLTVVMILVIVAGLIAAGLMVQQVFLEPQRQHSYEFEVTSKLNDWCAGSATDPFNQQTLAALKTDRDSDPDRFAKLPYAVRESINAAVRGDHTAACGY